MALKNFQDRFNSGLNTVQTSTNNDKMRAAEEERRRKEKEQMLQQQKIQAQRKALAEQAKTKQAVDFSGSNNRDRRLQMQEDTFHPTERKPISSVSERLTNEKANSLKPYAEYASNLDEDLYQAYEVSKAIGKKLLKEDLLADYDNQVDRRLSQIKESIKPGQESLGYSFKEGAMEREVMDMLSKESYRQLMGLPNNTEKINKFIEDNPELFANQEGSNFWKRTARGLTDVVLQQVNSVTSALPEVATYTATGAALGTAFATPTLGAAAPITTTAGALLGFKYGMKAGSAKYMYELEAGLAYNEMIKEGIPHEIAKPIAMGVGAVNGMIETVQLGRTIDNLPGMDEVIQKVKKEGLEASMASIKKLGLKYTTDLAQNIGEEVAQENVGMLGTEIAKVYQTEQDPNVLGGFKEYAKKIGSPEWRNIMRDTAVSTAESMWLLGPLSGAGGAIASQGARSLDNSIQNKQKNNLLYTQLPDLIKNAEKDIIADDEAIRQFTALDISLEEALKREDVSNKDKIQINKLKEELQGTMASMEYQAKVANGDMDFLPANEYDVEEMFLADDFNIEELELYNKGINELTLETYKKAKDLGILEEVKSKVAVDENRATIADGILKRLPKDERTIVNAQVVVDEVEKMMAEIKTQAIMNKFYNIVMAKDTIISTTPSEKENAVENGPSNDTEEGDKAQANTITQEGMVEPAEGQIESQEATEEDIAPTETETTEKVVESEDNSQDEFPRAEVFMVPVTKMIADPEKYQFRYDKGNKAGATNKLVGAEYNERLAGTILLRQDEFGDLYIINGHHRVNFAKENGITEMKAEIISYKDYSEAEARTLGAMINIAEDSATSIDVAKLMRDSGITVEAMKEYGIAPKSKIAKDGAALSKLEDWIFTQVATRGIPLERAVIIGNELGDNQPAQRQILREIGKLEAKGKTITNGVLTELIAAAKGTAQVEFTEQTLLGEEVFTKDVGVERAEIVEYVKGQLKSRVSVLKNVTKEKNANLLQELGNKIAIDDNVKEMNTAEQALYILDKTLNYQGTKTNELFNKFAKEYQEAEPKDRMKIKKRALAELIKAMEGGNLFNEKSTRRKRESVKETISVDKGTGTDGQQGPGINDNRADQEIDQNQVDLFGLDALNQLKETDKVKVTVNKGTELWTKRDIMPIVEAMQNNVFFNGLTVEFTGEASKRYWTREELDNAGYKQSKEGIKETTGYYIPGDSSTNQTRDNGNNTQGHRGTIYINNGAAKDTILHEIIHVIQDRINTINPKLGVLVDTWENEIRKEAIAKNIPLMDGKELLAHALLHSEFGYAKDNAIGDLVAVDSDIVRDMSNIIGEDILRLAMGKDQAIPRAERELKAQYDGYARRAFLSKDKNYRNDMKAAMENRKAEMVQELTNNRAVQYHSPNNKTYVIVSPSLKGHKYQATYFDALGPIMDMQADNVEDLATEIMRDGYFYKADEIHYQLKDFNRGTVDKLYGRAVQQIGFFVDKINDKNIEISDNEIVELLGDARIGNLQPVDFDNLILHNENILGIDKVSIVNRMMQAINKGYLVPNKEVTMGQYLNRFYNIPMDYRMLDTQNNIETRIRYNGENGKLEVVNMTWGYNALLDKNRREELGQPVVQILGSYNTLERAVDGYLEAIDIFNSIDDKVLKKVIKKHFLYTDITVDDLKNDYQDFKDNIETFRAKGIETEFTGNPHYAISYQLKEGILNEEDSTLWRFPNTRGELTIEKVERYLKDVSGSNSFNKVVSEFESPEKLKEKLFWHGTSNYIDKRLRAGFRIPEAQRGGGYGEIQHTVSLSKSKKVASNFSGTSRSVSIYPVVIREGAKIIDRPDISDAIELEDELLGLWKDKVDAVAIGDWESEYSEKELVVLNPRIMSNVGKAEHYQVYGLKVEEPTMEEITTMWEDAKKAIEEAKANRKKVDYQLKAATDTPEFKKWFKDSKVVDEEGNPLMLYHGTNSAGFTEFDSWFNNMKRPGFFFTDSISVARGYSRSNDTIYPMNLDTFEDAQKSLEEYDMYLEKIYWNYGKGLFDTLEDLYEQYPDATDIREVYELRDGSGNVVETFKTLDELRKTAGQYAAEKGDKKGVYEVYLKIQNPYIIDGDYSNWDDVEGMTTNDWVKEVISYDAGYDGIIFKNISDNAGLGEGISNVYVAFNPTQIKSVYNNGMFNEYDPNINYQLKSIVDVPGFYSNLEKILNEKMGKRAKASDLMNMLMKNGVKPEEVEWFKIADFLADKDFVYKEEVLDHMRTKSIEFTTEDMGNEFSTYTLDGGDNYRFNAYVYNNNPGNPFTNPAHFGKLENVIGHTRYKDRIGANGEKILLIEELQSDWHQKGRQEGYSKTLSDMEVKTLQGLEKQLDVLADDFKNKYGSEWLFYLANNETQEMEMIQSQINEIKGIQTNIPDAPLKESITDFLIKQAIKDAVEGGYDYIAWTTGTQQADRYNMRKFVDNISWLTQEGKDKGILLAMIGDTEIFEKEMYPNEIADYVGKQLAQELLSRPVEMDIMNIVGTQSVDGDDLSIGGEFHKKLYDNYVPRMLKKYGKKWGLNVGNIKMLGSDGSDDISTLSLNYWDARLEILPNMNTEELITTARQYGVVDVYVDRLIESPDNTSYREQLENQILSQIENGVVGPNREDIMLENFIIQPSIPVTPQMIEDVMTQGQPLFQMKDVPRTNGNLLAVHNLTEAQLKNIIKLGGFPMPSIAIVDKGYNHNRYGEISVLFGRSTIDPQANRYNRVYGGDAYTPTFPPVQYKVNDKVAKSIRERVNSVIEDSVYKNVFSSYLDSDLITDRLNRYGNFSEAYSDDAKLMLTYLNEKGIPFEPVVTNKNYGWDLELLEMMHAEFGDLVGTGYITQEQAAAIAPRLRELINEYYGTELYKEPLGFGQVDRMADAIRAYGKDTSRTEIERWANERKLIETVDKDDFIKWLDEISQGIIEKEGFRNNKDLFTNSGTRRTWESLHDEVTLDKIVKYMREQDDVAADSWYGIGQFIAASSKIYKSVDEIRQDSNRLSTVDEQEYEAIKDGYSNRLVAIAKSLLGESSDSSRNYFMDIDTATGAIIEAIKASKSRAGILKELKEYRQLNVTGEILDEIIQLSNEVATMPTEYFEAKPKRAVYLSEIQAIIAPYGLSQEVEQMLRDNGINLIEKYYDISKIGWRRFNDGSYNLNLMDTEGNLRYNQTPVTIEEMRAALARYNLDTTIADDISNSKENWGLLEPVTRQMALNNVLRQNDVSFQLKETDTNTENFKNWFKDSKVVDEEGNPLKMYHGTNHKFDKFQTEMIPQFFTTLREYAEGYTNTNNIMQVYLNIKKPFDTTDEEARKIYNEEFIPYIKEKRNRDIEPITVSRMVDFVEVDKGLYPFLRKMQREGKLDYDGIIVDEKNDLFYSDSRSFIPLQANQIKSVYNYGAWDVNEANIYYQLKEEPDMEERSWGQTVRDANLTTKWLSELLTSNKFMYEVKHNTATLIAAARYLDEKGEDYVEARLMSEIPNDTILFAASQMLTYKYMEEGQQSKALKILEKTAEKATSMGQAIQILSVWGRLTPEGMLRETFDLFKRGTTNKEKERVVRTTEDMRVRFNELVNRFINDVDLVGTVEATVEITEQDRLAQWLTTEEGKKFIEKYGLEAIAKKEIPEGDLKAIEDFIKKTPIDKEKVESIIETIKGHYKSGKGDLRQKLIDNGLSEVEAEVLSKRVKQQVKDGIKVEAAEVISKIKKQKYEKTTLDQEIIDLVVDGQQNMLDDNKLQNLLAEKLGMPVMSKQLTDYIYQQGQHINSLAPGRERDVATAKLIQEIMNHTPVSFWTKLKTFQTIAQLLNFKTTLRNLIGNRMFRELDTFTLNFFGTPIDKLLAAATKQRTMVFRYGDARKAQKKGYRQGRKLGIEDAILGINTFQEDTKFEFRRNRVFTEGVLGKAEMMLDIALRATDRAAYTAAFYDSLEEQMKIAKVDAPTEEMTERAAMIGLYRTFNDETALSSMFSGIKSNLNRIGFGGEKGKPKEFGLGELIMKYPKTPANILGRAIDYSPAGFVVTALKLFADTDSYTKQRAVAEGLSRAIMGTGLIAIGALFAQAGILTGSNPEDDEDIYKLQKSYGLRDFSVNVSSIPRYILSGFQDPTAGELKKGDVIASYDWVEPIAMPLAVGADVILGSGETMDLLSTIIRTLETGASTLTDQPLLSGVANLFRYGDPVEGFTQIVKGIPGSFTPSLFAHAAQFVDGRDVDSYTFYGVGRQAYNMVANRVPGLRNTLPSRYTTLGDEKRYYPENMNFITRAINTFLNPAITSKYMPPKEAELLFDLYNETGDSDIVPRPPQKTYTIDKTKYTFDPESWEKMSNWLGDEYKSRIGYAMNTYMKSWSVEDQAEEIKFIIKEVKEEARERVKKLGTKVD